MKTLITNAIVVTVDEDMRVIDPCTVLIDGNRIADVGPSANLEKYINQVDIHIDGTDKLIVPGFISLHNHLGYTLFRGLSEEVGHRCVTGMYYPMGTIATDSERLAVGSLTCAELLSSGIKTIVEMEERAWIYAPFIERIGIRAEIGAMIHDCDVDKMANGIFEFSEEMRDEQLAGAIKLLDDWHGAADGRIRGMMSPNMTISSSPKLLNACRDEANKRGLHLSMHLGWGPEEVGVIQNLHGKTPFEYARDEGLLAQDTIMAHCLYSDEDDHKVLAETGTSIAHCPLMNSVRGHIAPIKKYRANSNTVGLGIDNMFADHLDVIRSALVMARVLDDDPMALMAADALRLATIEGAKALGRDHELGSIEVGKIADLTILNTHAFGMKPMIDPVANLVYHAHSKDVETVIVDGKIVVENGTAIHVDADKLLTEAQFAAENAWSRFEDKYGGRLAGDQT